MKQIGVVVCMVVQLSMFGCARVDEDDSGPEHPQREDEGDGHEVNDSGNHTPDGPDPSRVPRVLDGDIWCYEHNTGEIRYYWSMVAQATDPQGDQTLQALHEGLSVRRGGVETARYTIVCTDTGSCTASFEEARDDIRCNDATSYEFNLEVIDEDGNLSAPFSMIGRVGSSASGR